MKATMDYMVGNTAIQIVNTGKKIKIIDVEKEKVKRRFWKKLLLVLAVGIMMFSSCFYVVKLQNTETLLDRQIYDLKGQIEDLQHENTVLEKENEDQEIDYKTIYKKALEMGMKFPSNNQIYEYHVDKSTAVRINF